jgi:Lrp/AsnC family transcriptional regulator of ectoine degradation
VLSTINYRTESDALAPENGPFSCRISAARPVLRAKIRRHLFDHGPRPVIVENRENSAANEKAMAHRHMIDEMDLKIMKRLQLDARISNVHLAQSVHLSPSACLERVKSLEKLGLIRRYIADYDLSKISSTVSLLVEVILENHREADFERFLAAIRKRDEVLECYKIGGRIDYLMRVLCRDIEHYNELSDYMSRGELGVEKFHGHVVLAVDKAFQGYPLDLLIEP